MRAIELDATDWKTVLDFYRALLSALGAPSWHGNSIDAVIDSIVWGGINAVEPPYIVRIIGLEGALTEIRDEVKLLDRSLAEARAEYYEKSGRDVQVTLEFPGKNI